MEKYTQDDVKIAVANEVQNMLYNNITKRNGGESFVGWCEDGEVFQTNPEYEKYGEQFVTDCINLMRLVAPSVDKVGEILNLF